MSEKQLIILLITILAIYFLVRWQEVQENHHRYRPPTPPSPYQPGWNTLHYDFNDSTFVNHWKQAGYDYHSTQKWIECGVKPSELALVKWIREVKGVSPHYILNRWGNVNPLRNEWNISRLPPGILLYQ